MDTAGYKLRYTQDFVDDFRQIIDYISITFAGPDAAQRLADDVRDAIHQRSFMPTVYEPYHSRVQLNSVYYQLRVQNYTVFYVVLEDVMEVRRILYTRRNWKALL